jgi:4-hydroxy-tetrahydrodipicolinate reductase
VVLYGVGAIGGSIAKFLLEKDGIEIVGAIDNAKEKVGKDLGEVLQIDKRLGIVISDDSKKILSKARCDVVIHSTSSYLKEVYPQIAPLAEYGINVVSTCEELSYPFVNEPDLAKKLDILGMKYGVTFLGAGINPGYLMDALVIMLTGVCQKVDKITVERVMDAGTRRVTFQKRIGAGLSVREFKKKIEEKAITGHGGLKQSIGMIASALCWELDKIEADLVEPVIAVKKVASDAIKVEKGYVTGLRQKAKGIKKNKDLITLDFQAYIGAEEEYDAIRIDGVPPINQKITPCVHGDLATVAIIVNSIPKLMNAAPGLVTMKDLSIVSAAMEDMRRYVYGFTKPCK